MEAILLVLLKRASHLCEFNRKKAIISCLKDTKTFPLNGKFSKRSSEEELSHFEASKRLERRL